jgi:hypothetical protein
VPSTTEKKTQIKIFNVTTLAKKLAKQKRVMSIIIFDADRESFELDKKHVFIEKKDMTEE